MFFEESSEKTIARKKRFAKKTVIDFYKLAMSDDLPPEDILKTVNRFLKWLNACANHFEKRKNSLQKIQKKLQQTALEQDDKGAFLISASMSTMIFYLSKPAKNEYRKYFIENIQLGINQLTERKAKLEQHISKTQPELSLQDNPSISTSSPK